MGSDERRDWVNFGTRFDVDFQVSRRLIGVKAFAIVGRGAVRRINVFALVVVFFVTVRASSWDAGERVYCLLGN